MKGGGYEEKKKENKFLRVSLVKVYPLISHRIIHWNESAQNGGVKGAVQWNRNTSVCVMH